MGEVVNFPGNDYGIDLKKRRELLDERNDYLVHYVRAKEGRDQAQVAMDFYGDKMEAVGEQLSTLTKGAKHDPDEPA